MSGLNGQFNARLQRLEKMQDSATEVPKPTSADAGKVVTVNEDGDGYVLAEGGGSTDCNCVYNFGSPSDYEPFNVPDLINGGTRLFTPGVDNVLYAKINNVVLNVLDNGQGLYTDKIPPGYAKPINRFYMITSWESATTEAIETGTESKISAFAVLGNSTITNAELYDGIVIIVNPRDIVYMDVPSPE